MSLPNGIAARMWLLMLKEGGLWTSTELASELDYDRASLHNAANAMSEAGSVRKHEQTAKHNVRFSVSADCLIPRTVTLAQILACDLGRMAA